mgnify:CR=1 FL=1|tara:strand:+ start:778 stop:1014 length:237 start_codon:yes stop_codon:yes gene_type:complete
MNKTNSTFYDFNETSFRKAFQFDKDGTDVSVHKIKNEFYVRTDAGGAESTQIVFTAAEFAGFVDRCNKMIAVGNDDII